MLDSHVLIWLAFTPRRIPPRTFALIDDGATSLFFSVASVWELAIKARQQKLANVRPDEFADFLTEQQRAIRFEFLDISASHALGTIGMPGHHHDPFDRLLIAQAQVEGLPIVTADKLIARYPGRIVW